MWVVKMGGSLGRDPALPQWLELLTQLGGGRVTLVAGGGAFADEARRAQSHWSFGDVAGHNMAVLAMAQTAWLLRALNPRLQPAHSEADIRRILRKGQTALWMPLEMLRETPDDSTSWDVTSDSLALTLARRLNAERLIVVKACEIEGSPSFEQLSQAGVLDQRFPALAKDAAFPIEVVNKDELARMRAMLLGDVRVSA
jgi:aspartokinase-like uncharacterized kinase